MTNHKITMQDWMDAGCFGDAVKAVKEKGAIYPIEVDEEIYDDMLGAVPPIECGAVRKFLDGSEAHNYFLVGEAATMGGGRLLYSMFSRNDDGRCFYHGVRPTI